MSKKIIFLLVVVFLFSVGNSFSQVGDSLMKLLPTIKQDTEKIKILNEIVFNYSDVFPDTSLKCADTAIFLSKLEIKKNNKNNQRAFEFLVESYYSKGFAYAYQYDKYMAISYLDSAKTLMDSIENNYSGRIRYYDDKTKILNTYAGVYLDAGEYNIALSFYQQVIALKEELIRLGKIDESSLIGDYFNLGLVHYYNGNLEKALDYYLKTLTISIQTGNKYGEAMCYNNIGIVYLDELKTNEALRYFNKSLNIAEEIGAITLVAQNYDNIGNTYASRQNYSEAERFYMKSLELTNELGNKQGLIFIQMNLADLYLETGKNNLALNYAQKALENALNINALSQIKSAYRVLSGVYEKTGNYKLALENHKQFVVYNDSVFNSEKNKQIEEMESKYQFEKKQQEIEKQKLEILKNKETIKRQNAQRITLFAVIILVLIILIIVYRNFKVKVRINKELEEKNTEINLQKEEITSQAENLRVANTEILEQKQELEGKHNLIKSSIAYASRIQKAMMPFYEDFRNNFKDFFILYKPRDVVSGDFYWFMDLGEKIIFAAVDCTGHGVPGAFVSMLGISLLNEIGVKNKFENAADVLEELRNNVKKALHQTGEKNEQQEGMDVALCVMNKDKKSMTFAGAHNPLYIVRNNNLLVYEATKSPISIFVKEKEFMCHNVDLQKDDLLYIFSDGYKDQFNSDNQKIGAKKFKELLVENCDSNLQQKEDFLLNFYEEWKGNYSQIDDILIIGLKI
ncbi:MAG: tetratricopeptide repeat protein [Bacteroidales bacterium]|nr:tetratricopeptide repeat protein [Bacteroidales bacterium]